MTARYKERQSWGTQVAAWKVAYRIPVLFTKGNERFRAFENANSSKMIFSEIEYLILIYLYWIGSQIKLVWRLLHLWQVDDQQFRCPLEQLAKCFEIQIRIYCWILSITDMLILQGQGSSASLNFPASLETSCSVRSFCTVGMWLPVYLSIWLKPLIIMQLSGTI